MGRPPWFRLGLSLWCLQGTFISTHSVGRVPISNVQYRELYVQRFLSDWTLPRGLRPGPLALDEWNSTSGSDIFQCSLRPRKDSYRPLNHA